MLKMLKFLLDINCFLIKVGLALKTTFFNFIFHLYLKCIKSLFEMLDLLLHFLYYSIILMAIYLLYLINLTLIDFTF